MRIIMLQQALLSALSPIFEEEFLDCSFAYRPGRSALNAIDMVGALIKDGFLMETSRTSLIPLTIIYCSALLRKEFPKRSHKNVLCAVLCPSFASNPLLNFLLQPSIDKYLGRDFSGYPLQSGLQASQSSIHPDHGYQRTLQVHQWAQSNFIVKLLNP